MNLSCSVPKIVDCAGHIVHSQSTFPSQLRYAYLVAGGRYRLEFPELPKCFSNPKLILAPVFNTPGSWFVPLIICFPSSNMQSCFCLFVTTHAPSPGKLVLWKCVLRPAPLHLMTPISNLSRNLSPILQTGHYTASPGEKKFKLTYPLSPQILH